MYETGKHLCLALGTPFFHHDNPGNERKGRSHHQYEKNYEKKSYKRFAIRNKPKANASRVERKKEYAEKADSKEIEIRGPFPFQFVEFYPVGTNHFCSPFDLSFLDLTAKSLILSTSFVNCLAVKKLDSGKKNC